MTSKRTTFSSTSSTSEITGVRRVCVGILTVLLLLLIIGCPNNGQVNTGSAATKKKHDKQNAYRVALKKLKAIVQEEDDAYGDEVLFVCKAWIYLKDAYRPKCIAWDVSCDGCCNLDPIPIMGVPFTATHTKTTYIWFFGGWEFWPENEFLRIRRAMERYRKLMERINSLEANQSNLSREDLQRLLEEFVETKTEATEALCDIYLVTGQ